MLSCNTSSSEEGIVPGGGTALLYSIKSIKDLKGHNSDQSAGIDIIRKALEAPARQISENAGVEGSIVIGNFWSRVMLIHGFDAQSEKYTDLVKAGIIDPVKVVRTALENASSIASLLLTTEAWLLSYLSQKNQQCLQCRQEVEWVEWEEWVEWIFNTFNFKFYLMI